MALNWDKPVCTKRVPPLIGDVSATHTGNGKRCVQLPSLSLRMDLAVKTPTTCHYDDAGNCSVIGDPNEYDLVNFDPDDGVERFRVSRER